MKCFAKYVLPMVIALGSAVIAPGLSRVAVASEDPAALQADREFVRAAAKGDKEAVGKLLDADFTWTDAQGQSYTKSETLTALPQLKVSDASDAREERRSYGQVVAVMAGQGKAYALRVRVGEAASGMAGAGVSRGDAARAARGAWR